MSRSNGPAQTTGWPAAAQPAPADDRVTTGGRGAQRPGAQTYGQQAAQPQAQPPAHNHLGQPAQGQPTHGQAYGQPQYQPAHQGYAQQGYAEPAFGQAAYQPQQPQTYAAPQPQAYAQPAAQPAQYPGYPEAAPAQQPTSYGHQPAYYYPQAPEPAADPYARQQAGTGAGYMPQFDPYVPPSQPSQGRGAYGQPQAQPKPQPQHQALPAFEPEPQYAPQQPSSAGYGNSRAGQPTESALSQLSAGRGRPQLSEFQGFDAPPTADSWPAPQRGQTSAPAFSQVAPAQPAQSRFEPASAFPPSAHEPPFAAGYGQAGGQEPAFGRAPQAQPQSQEPAFDAWPPRDRFAPAPQMPGQGEHGLGDMTFDGALRRGADPGHAMPAAEPQHGGALEASYEHDEGDYEDEEPKKRSSIFMVVGALSAAIIVGGGAAYLYQKMGGTGGAQVAVVKGDPSPSKTKPAEAGGKQFSGTGSKVMTRLNDGSAPSETPAGDVDANGTRRVTTLPITKDGAIAAPPPSAAPVSVPGVAIVDGFGSRPPPVAAQPLPAAAPVVVQPPPVASTPSKPVVIARASPAQVAAPVVPAAPAMAEEPVAKAVKKALVAPKKKVVDAYGAAVAAAPAAAAPVTGGSGFVPVLVSIPAAGKTNADALAQFADIRARYASVLDGREPVIKEIDRGDKGLYYRVMAGPPGSKEQANSLCEQLKAQGHKDCWVSGY